jgi:hypothetical protein
MMILYFYFYSAPKPFAQSHEALLEEIKNLNEGKLLEYKEAFDVSFKAGIGSLCDIRTGILESRHREGIEKAGTITRILRPSHLQANLAQLPNLDELQEAKAVNEKHFLTKNDLLYTYINQFECHDVEEIFMNLGIKDSQKTNLAVNHFIYVISPKLEALEKFNLSLTYFKIAVRLTLETSSISTNAANATEQNQGKMQALRNIMIPIPSKEAQLAIVHAFERLDAINSDINKQKDYMARRILGIEG